MIRYFLAGVVVLSAISVQGQVVVEMVNMPREVYSLEPVYVLYSIENIGKEPIYLPAELAPARGRGLYIGRNGETPQPIIWPHPDRLFSHTMTTMWLAPGERWLFYRDIGRKVGLLEGEVSIQAVLSSDGPCGDHVSYGRQQFPLNSRHIQSVQAGISKAEVYECWQGEARSNAWALKVRKSEGPEDLKAYEYLIADGRLKKNREQGTWSMRWGAKLEDEYPSSRYTYISLAQQTSVYAKKRAVELQPDNPLNPWVMADIADHVLKRRSRCSTDPPLKFELDIEKLELPDGLREYLDQQEWYYDNRYCEVLERQKRPGR